MGENLGKIDFSQNKKDFLASLEQGYKTWQEAGGVRSGLNILEITH